MFCKSTHDVSSDGSKNTNHSQISLTGTDHYNSKFSKGIQFEKNNHSVYSDFRKSSRKSKLISDIFWAFKSKWQTKHAPT